MFCNLVIHLRDIVEILIVVIVLYHKVNKSCIGYHNRSLILHSLFEHLSTPF